MRQASNLLLFIFFALALSGCNADDATRSNTFLELTGITITSEYDSIANLTNSQFTAMGDYSGEFDSDITTEVTWGSSPPGILTIDSAGLATAVSSGDVTVTAELEGIEASFEFSVSDAVIDFLTVTPATQEAPVGVERDYDVSGTFDDGSTQSLDRLATWTSLNPDIAGVSSTGSATGIAVGTAAIVAAWQGEDDVATLNVTEAELIELAITPADAEYPAGLTIQYTLTGFYSDGNTEDLTDQAYWESDDTTNATVDNAAGEEGKVEMLASGNTDIMASYTDVQTGGWDVSTSLQVNSSTLREILIYATVYNTDDSIDGEEDQEIDAGETFEIDEDQTVYFTAKGEYSDNEEYNITQLADWTSSDPDIATISNNEGATKGIAKPGSETGETTIKASFDDMDIEFTLDVIAL